MTCDVFIESHELNDRLRLVIPMDHQCDGKHISCLNLSYPMYDISGCVSRDKSGPIIILEDEQQVCPYGEIVTSGGKTIFFLACLIITFRRYETSSTCSFMLYLYFIISFRKCPLW
jgi:hypothetical protein